MLTTLDSAALVLSSDEMLVGTLVFMLARRGLHSDAALVANSPRCSLPAPRCQLLRGYVHQASGNTMSASAAFDSALVQLAESERCQLLNAWALLDETDRASYATLSCAARASRDSAFWWLSDPSYLVPGNDRLTEHLARAVGNRILERYRAAKVIIDRVIWWAGAIPRSDSAERFFDYPRWVQHPAGPWRWYDELTRFGMPDAIEVIPGVKKRPAPFFNCAGLRGTATHGSGGSGFTVCDTRDRIPPAAVCRWGFEPRELSIPNVPPDTLRWPDYGPHKPLFPAYTFYRYHWSNSGSSSCARLYNTRARHEFTPVWRATAGPFAMLPDAWQLGGEDEFVGGPPYREQYTPRYAPVVSINHFQIARLPRGDSMLVMAVTQNSGDGLDTARARSGAGKWETALLATSKVPPQSPIDVKVVRSHSETFTPRQVLTAMMPTSSIFAALEILTPDTLGFARMRMGIPISPWLEGDARLSDIVFFRPDTSSSSASAVTVTSLDSVIPRALPTLTVPRGEPLGLYWEAQVPEGIAGPAEANVSLSVERVDKAGLFGRIVGGLFGGRNGGVRSISWTTPVPRPTGARHTRWGSAVSVATNTLQPGDYELAIVVSGVFRNALTTKRSMTVVRPLR